MYAPLSMFKQGRCVWKAEASQCRRVRTLRRPPTRHGEMARMRHYEAFELDLLGRGDRQELAWSLCNRIYVDGTEALSEQVGLT